MNVNAALRLLQAGALCFLLLSTNAAVIEVTAGGEVSEPTYRFSDASGNALATLVGNSTALSASADVVTGNGNSVDDLATTMASLQATIAQLNATVAQLDAQVTSLQNQVEGKMDAMSVDSTMGHGSSNLITSKAIHTYVNLVRNDIWGDLRYYYFDPHGW